MAANAAEILQDIVNALRGTGVFEIVSLGDSGSSTVTPRASVLFDTEEFFQPDDVHSMRWIRLCARVRLRLRSANSAEGIARATDLCVAAAEAILEDPYRGQRCQHLPVGRATEVARCEINPSLRRPEIEVILAVRCHFETQEGV